MAPVSSLAFVLAMFIPLQVFARAPVSRPAAGGTSQVGIASWHAPRWNETRTASGRRWLDRDLVAAHRSLPFGSRIRVVNLRNGRNVIVQITDRGPYGRGRVIDVSRSAAAVLDLIDAGSAPVRLEKLRAGE